MMMIGLRTIWGVDLNKVNQNFSSEIIDYFNKESNSKIEDGLLTIENNHLKIPEKHWFLADGIASDLFMV
jgi:oxygen-independent coproporphyrinogen-3 oxidase